MIFTEQSPHHNQCIHLLQMHTKFILTPKDIQLGNSHLIFSPFQHPKDNRPIVFALAQPSNQIYILQKTIERPQSWIVGCQIIQDGTCYFLSPFDSIFLWLPIFKRQCQVDESKYLFKSDRDILSNIENEWHNWNSVESEVLNSSNQSALMKFLSADILVAGNFICDVMEENEEQYFKFSQEKVIQWLDAKLQMIRDGIQENENISNTIRKTCGHNALQKEIDEAFLLHALQLLGEFVSEEFMQPLAKSKNMDHLLFPSASTTIFSRTESSNTITELEFIKSMEKIPKSMTKEPIKPKKKAKVNTKEYTSLTSFFKKKET